MFEGVAKVALRPNAVGGEAVIEHPATDINPDDVPF
jgi:hypothetical protein